MARLEVFVAELDTICVEEVRASRVIFLKDPENLTDEHVKRLRDLVNTTHHSQPLELGILDEKLKRLAENPASRAASPAASSDRTLSSSVADAQELPNDLREELEAYNDLIQDGAQPSHPFDPSGFSIVENPGEYTDIITYWRLYSHKSRLFRTQRWKWKAFRDYQDAERVRWRNPELFKKRAHFVNAYRGKMGLEGTVNLLYNRKEQSRLDDWKEYQFREYRSADGFLEDMERFEKDMENERGFLQAAIAAELPAKEIESMGLDYRIAKGQRGWAEVHYKRKAMLLAWIDKQLPIIASESATTNPAACAQDDDVPSQISTSLGKRKRSLHSPVDSANRRRKVTSDHLATSSRRTVDNDSHSGPAISLTTEPDHADSTPASIREHPVPKHGLRRSTRLATLQSIQP